MRGKCPSPSHNSRLQIAETPAFMDRAKKILENLLDHSTRKVRSFAAALVTVCLQPNTTDIEDDKHCTVKSLSKLADDSGDFAALIVKAGACVRLAAFQLTTYRAVVCDQGQHAAQ